MNGRLYIIVADGGLHLTSEMDSLGDGEYIYSNNGRKFVASARDIIMFANSYGSDMPNRSSLSYLFEQINAARYNPDGLYRGYMENGTIIPLQDYADFQFGVRPRSRKIPQQEERELFHRINDPCNLLGLPEHMLVGSKGTILIFRDGKYYGVVVRWAAGLSDNKYGAISVMRDAFSYVVSCTCSADKPPRGYSTTSNEICGVISGFQRDGISTKRLEEILKNIPHPTLMARISELSAIGRIVSIGEVRLYPRGSSSSIWRLAGI